MGLVLNLPTKWSNVTPDMENIWLAVCFTEEMLFPRMLMQLLLPLRPKDQSNLWIGVLLVSRLVSITNLLLLFQEVTLLKYLVLFACCPIPLPLLKLGLPLRRIMKKLAWTLWKAKARKEKNTKKLYLFLFLTSFFSMTQSIPVTTTTLYLLFLFVITAH